MRRWCLRLPRGRRCGSPATPCQAGLGIGTAPCGCGRGTARRAHAARRLIGRAAAEGATALQAVGFGGEGDHVQPEQILQRRSGTPRSWRRARAAGRLWTARPDCCRRRLRAGQNLPVNRRQLCAAAAPRCGAASLSNCVRPAESAAGPRASHAGAGPFTSRAQAREAGVDVDLVVVEQAARSRVPARRQALPRGRTAQRW